MAIEEAGMARNELRSVEEDYKILLEDQKAQVQGLKDELKWLKQRRKPKQIKE